MNQALEAGNDRRYNRYARRTLGASLLGLIVIVVLSPAMPPEFLLSLIHISEPTRPY